MTLVLVFDAPVLTGCGRFVWKLTFQSLNACHFVVGDHLFSLFGQLWCLAIQCIDGVGPDVEELIFDRVQPVADPVGTNRGFFLKASPHGGEKSS